MKKRIVGVDVARAFAVIGMIIVNFKMAIGSEEPPWLNTFFGFLEGKAAATFVVLAGIGIAFMSKSALENHDRTKLRNVRHRIAKRALALFLVGVSYLVICPADILHFYGVYMLIMIFLLGKSSRTVFIWALGLILIYPILMSIIDYDTGWDFDTFEYQGFWTISGFLRNLCYNGFHPVIPWTSFMLIGYWYGSKDLNSIRFVKKSFAISISLFVGIQIVSLAVLTIFSQAHIAPEEELKALFGTSPMPPLPIYMLNGITISISVVSACILIAKRFENNRLIDALKKTGQLALTFYVAHVVLGMGSIEAINPSKMGTYSFEFTLSYAIAFSMLCVIFAIVWRTYKKSGPLEWLLRKLTDSKPVKTLK